MTIPTIASYSLPAATELPVSKVSWQADPARAVLLVHDMQEYFLDFFGAESPLVRALVDNVRRLRDRCRAAAIPVVYTAQPTEQSDEQRGLLNDMWGPGITAKPGRAGIHPALRPASGETVLTKWRYSAFERSELDDILRREGWDQLIICGVYAHIGCLLTACAAFMRDVRPFLVADGVADFSLEEHRMALDYVAGRCGVVVSTDQLLTALSSGPTLDGVRAQIAAILDLTLDEVGPDDNLMDLGLDSIRAMSLAERWRRQGIVIAFQDLAERSTAAEWYELLAERSGAHA